MYVACMCVMSKYLHVHMKYNTNNASMWHTCMPYIGKFLKTINLAVFVDLILPQLLIVYVCTKMRPSLCVCVAIMLILMSHNMHGNA